MRGLILALALIACFVSSDAQAQDNNETKVYKLKCMSPWASASSPGVRFYAV